MLTKEATLKHSFLSVKGESFYKYNIYYNVFWTAYCPFFPSKSLATKIFLNTILRSAFNSVSTFDRASNDTTRRTRDSACHASHAQLDAMVPSRRVGL